jgi:hypothetical protein
MKRRRRRRRRRREKRQEKNHFHHQSHGGCQVSLSTIQTRRRGGNKRHLPTPCGLLGVRRDYLQPPYTSMSTPHYS